MKKYIKFVDGKNNLVKVEFESERGHVSLMGDYADGSCGQIYDDVEPRTDLQRELIETWKENQLKADVPTLVEKITNLMDKVQVEYDEFYASLLQEDNFPSIDDDDACMSYLMDDCGYYEDDATRILAAVKANDYDLRVINYVDTPDYSLCQTVTIFGVEYYVCKESRIDEIASDYLTNNDELWREAVYSGDTTLGLIDWVDEAVNIDGALSVLGWSEIDTVEVQGTYYVVAVQD